MDPDESELLTATVRDALAHAAPHASTGSAIDALLAELGWSDMLASAPSEAISIVFSCLGYANAASSALDDALLDALGVDTLGVDAARCIVLPARGTDPPARRDGDRLVVDGIATVRAETASEFVVVVDGAAFGLPAASVRVASITGIDPRSELHRVQFSGLLPKRLQELIVERSADWTTVVARAHHALAAEMIGVNRAMLELACEHALSRVQFDRPIATFQAVRHRLAESLVAIEALGAAVDAATEEPSPILAMLAKAIGGRTTRTVAAHCQQVLAGIGFTTDHAFHRYLKRGLVLDELFGTADDLALAIGRTLMSEGSVPTLVEL